MSKTAHKGLRRYAQIIALTRQRPMQMRELLELIGGAGASLRELLHAMPRLGLLREAEWTKPGHRIRPIPGYSSTAGDRLPDPSTGKLLDVVSRRNSAVSADLVAFAAVITRMAESPASTYELAEASGLGYLTMRALLNDGKAVGAFREAKWICREGPPGGCKIALWACDGKRPAPKPRPMTASEIGKRYDARKREAKQYEKARKTQTSVFAWAGAAA